MKIARAGHTQPFIVSSSGQEPKQIESKGIAIGMADAGTFDAELEELSVTLKPGDVFVTYTDGVFETLNSRQQEWSVRDLQRTVLANATASAQSILTRVRHELLEFVGDMPQYDDMTLVVMSRRKETANS